MDWFRILYSKLSIHELTFKFIGGNGGKGSIFMLINLSKSL